MTRIVELVAMAICDEGNGNCCMREKTTWSYAKKCGEFSQLLRQAQAAVNVINAGINAMLSAEVGKVSKVMSSAAIRGASRTSSKKLGAFSSGFNAEVGTVSKESVNFE